MCILLPGGRKQLLKFWLQMYRRYELPGLVTDFDLFTKMAMTGKEREVLMEVMPYVLMFYQETTWARDFLEVVVCRNTWAALRDRNFHTAATLTELEKAGAPPAELPMHSSITDERISA